MRRLWLWFLAFFHFSDSAVCEMSRGSKGPWTNYHDWDDSVEGFPDHLMVLHCKRCGQEFRI